ncbi:MAG: hypothetical protein ACKVVT_14465 [Dehalococcoidia bacterium]
MALRVECPAVGPSGQDTTGAVCLDATADEGPSSPGSFGPYRIWPAGAPYIERTGSSPDPTEVVTLTEVTQIQASGLYVAPVRGFEEVAVSQTLVVGEALQTVATWRRLSDGQSLVVGLTRVADDWLPLDVYLHPADSPTIVEPTMLDGRFAITERTSAAWGSRAIPPLTVQVWLGGRQLSLEARGLQESELLDVARAILASR